MIKRQKNESKLLISIGKRSLVCFSQDREDAGILANCTDRIPSIINVDSFDVFCLCFAMLTYTIDFFSDIGIGIFHIMNQRVIPGCLILTFSIVPSLILNAISFYWMINDHKNVNNDGKFEGNKNFTVNGYKRSIILFSIICFVQAGPLYWYYHALCYSLLFIRNKSDERRRFYYMKMVEYERDAVLLKFFEAYLESAPQITIQGTLLANNLHKYLSTNQKLPVWIYFQSFSIIASLISISWAIVLQNRTLRIVRDDKINLWPIEITLMFLWRLLTIASRITLLCTFLSSQRTNWFIPLGCHLVLSMIHITFLQGLNVKNHGVIEKCFILLCSFVHIFTPFNMAEGSTRRRYVLAYIIETIEIMALLYYLDNSSVITRISKIFIVGSFITGILIMCIYYKFFHPNRRNVQNNQQSSGIKLTRSKRDCTVYEDTGAN